MHGFQVRLSVMPEEMEERLVRLLQLMSRMGNRELLVFPSSLGGRRVQGGLEGPGALMPPFVPCTAVYVTGTDNVTCRNLLATHRKPFRVSILSRAKLGTCTVVSVNRTLVEDKMR